MTARLGWMALVVVVVAALTVGVLDDRGPVSDTDRARAVGETIQCPVCNGQSVVESDAPIAARIRAQIERQVAAGRSDADIQAFFADRYGDFVVLEPAGDGVTGLVWVLPVVGVAVAAAGLGLTLARWRVRDGRGASAADRALVDRARAAP